MADPQGLGWYPIPKERSLETLDSARATLLLGWGIVNPFGPTLSALVVEGDASDANSGTILYIMLNPFTQWVYEVAEGAYSRDWDLRRELIGFQNITVGGCPTFVAPRAGIADGAEVEFVTKFLLLFADGKATFDKVMEFPDDPVTRVDRAMKVAWEYLGESLSGKAVEAPPGYEWPPAAPRHMSVLEAEALAKHLLITEVMAAELALIRYCWDGAIALNVRSGGSLAASALTESEAFGAFWRMWNNADGSPLLRSR